MDAGRARAWLTNCFILIVEGWQNGYCTSLENWRPQGLGGSNPSPSAWSPLRSCPHFAHSLRLWADGRLYEGMDRTPQDPDFRANERRAGQDGPTGLRRARHRPRLVR